MEKRILSVLLAMVLSVAFCTSALATLYTVFTFAYQVIIY